MGIIQYLDENSIPYEENVSLSKKTWLKTGGIASILIMPSNIDQLRNVLHFLSCNAIDYQVVGQTTNIYYLDRTNPDIIVNTTHIKHYFINGSSLICDCGVPVASLSRELVSQGYQGFFGLINLPGTIGAATVNNSSCFDCSISELIERVNVYDIERKLERTLSFDDLKYSHRSSVLKRNELKAVVLSVVLRLKKGSIEREKAKAEKAAEIRKATQEKPAYTLGSVFAKLDERKSICLKIYRKVFKLLFDFGITKTLSRTHILLRYYGYLDLQPYVSEKNINTFIWKPEIVEKEAAFQRYCEFMHKAFVNPCLEIEIR